VTPLWKLDPDRDWDWSRPIFDHVDVFVRDLRESVRFYETVLAPLDVPMIVDRGDSVEFPNFGLVSGRPPSGPLHLAFRAATQAEVNAFHRAGVEGGFRDNGSPGERPEYRYYAAFLLDPDDNNVEAVFRGG
jgi:catechol 2,3-dioxygenase-like lactoylglutathione lyase family enzyme